MSDRCPITVSTRPNCTVAAVPKVIKISPPPPPPTQPTAESTTMPKPTLIGELSQKLSKKKAIVAMPMSGVKLKDEIKVIDNHHHVIPSDSLVANDSAVDAQRLSESGGEEPANVVGSTNGSTSGYGSEGYVSEEERKLKAVETTLDYLDIRDEQTHCARCHKSFDPTSCSNAERRCLLPHPTKMVIPIRRDNDGTHFVCLCCRTEFKLPKMTFYEAGVNSMLTGYCFIGQHTSDEDDIDYQYDGGAALSCEEAGCIEFFV